MENIHAVIPQKDWPWPAELDALIAAPDNHTLLFENEFVRVLDTVIPPGETTPLHTHCWPGAFYVLCWSDFVRRDQDGNIMADTRKIESLAAPHRYCGWIRCRPTPWKMWAQQKFAA